MITVTPLGLQLLQGRRVVLTRATPADAPFFYQCYQNEAFMDLYRLSAERRQTVEQIEQRLAKENQLLPQYLKRIEWIIQHMSADGEKQPIGITALADYQRSHQRAEFLLGIIPTEYRGTGLALETTLLVLDFAFNQAKLHKLIAYVYGYNQFAQTNAIHFGFTQEGLLREHIKSKQGFIDLYLNGLTEPTFRTHPHIPRFSQRLLGWDITNKPTPPETLSQEQITQAKKILSQIPFGRNNGEL